MEFKKVLSSLLRSFEEEKIRYGLMGGFSLLVLGIPRTTVDLDFLVHKDDLQKLDGLMERLGYKLFFRTDNVSQYTSPNPELGGVDFVHAFRNYARKMLERVQSRKLEDLVVKVLRPEDIIGLKVQAIANDPLRKNRELADIESIFDKLGNEIDQDLLREYFQVFGMEEEYNHLVKRHGDLNPGR